MSRPLRVLVIEDDPEFAFLTEARLGDAGHRVVVSPTMHEAMLRLEADEPFDVVLLDLGLPDIDGLAGVTTVGEETGLPVIVLSGDARPETRAEAARVGASAYLVKGEGEAGSLERTVREIAERDATAPSVTEGLAPYTGPDEHVAAGLAVLAAATGLPEWAWLRSATGPWVVTARHGIGEGPDVGDEVVPDDRLVDAAADVTRTQGTPVLTEPHPFAPATAVAALATGEGHPHGLLLGWSPVPVTTPTATPILVAHAVRTALALDVLENQRARARRRADIAGNAAAVDALTGLGNRRAFDLAVAREESRCARHGLEAVVFVLDLDRLKHVNDTQGHGAGDRYLRSAAAALNLGVRGGDTVFRIGGDEFAVLAPNCDVAAAGRVAARLRAALDAHGVEASIGWASRPDDGTLQEAAVTADGAMYAEKVHRRAGRGDGAPGSHPQAS